MNRGVPRLVAGMLTAALLLLGLLTGSGAAQAAPVAAAASTGQFHGVNWADPNDNFITGPNVPVGLSTSDSYATVYTKSTAILKGFQGLGANTVRLGFNAATTSGSWWNSYTAALDAATALGMNVIVAPWLQGGKVSDTTSFNQMWDTMINKYGTKSNFYFDIMNEPYGYNATDLTNFEASWLARYPSLPRGHVIVPGLYSDGNLCAVGSDSRLSGTLLSIHIYGMFGDSHTTEAAWVNDFTGNLCGHADRAVLTEFGVPMNTGANYNGPKDGTNDLSYLYAITDTVRNLGMGSVLWTGVKQTNQTQGPGPCENASCAITSLNGSGTDLSVSVTNQSGLDRLQWGWGTGTNPGGGSGGGTSTLLRGAGSNRCLDVPNSTTANSTRTEIWDCNGGANQSWTLNSSKELVVYGTKCLDASGSGTTAGTAVIIYDCHGGTNQQWTLNSDGTVTNALSGLCLDVTGAATANGTLVELWTCTGAPNQKWSRQ
ncbi:RICIN domain-containing protein [Actinacidiphila bryophytorum]|uniref:RICIN domain-containing protein n=1 Tax=Actinacidiphila bryophytorum TaxID=1436133 RepID=UPI002176E735|nr:RICIN domain-containing protein [Actinacidiphila bryophytorum]UWE10005.1 ricin-type beta-trefoil lectin domain protein [Actinacidiphila bryophytorum]